MEFLLSLLLSIKFRAYILKTDSMSPTLNKGDLVIIKKQNDYDVGDVITYINQKNIPVTHRVFEKEIRGERNVYTTKGDANSESDGNYLLKEEICGKAIYKSRIIGNIIEFLISIWGIGLLLIFPSGCMSGIFMRSIKRTHT